MTLEILEFIRNNEQAKYSIIETMTTKDWNLCLHLTFDFFRNSLAFLMNFA